MVYVLNITRILTNYLCPNLYIDARLLYKNLIAKA